MRLEVKVDEADVAQVKKGQKASFTVDAFPGRTFPARIERVDVGANATTSGSASSTTTGVIAYTARLTVNNANGVLRPGMTATADIVTTEKKNLLLVPIAALRFSLDRGKGASSEGGLTSVLAPRPMRCRGPRPDREATIGRGSQQTIYVIAEAGDDPEPVKIKVGESNGSQLAEGAQVVIGQFAGAESVVAARAVVRAGARSAAAGSNAMTNDVAPGETLISLRRVTKRRKPCRASAGCSACCSR